MVPSPLITVMCGSECLCDSRKSVWSWAGVTFTAPIIHKHKSTGATQIVWEQQYSLSMSRGGQNNRNNSVKIFLFLSFPRFWCSVFETALERMLLSPVPSSMSTIESVMMGRSLLVKGCLHCFPWTAWNKVDKAERYEHSCLHKVHLVFSYCSFSAFRFGVHLVGIFGISDHIGLVWVSQWTWLLSDC